MTRASPRPQAAARNSNCPILRSDAGNTLLGAVFVLAGGLVSVLAIAWWRRDSEAGFNAFLTGIVEFISRAP
jgi:hypothetical protein